MTPCPRCGRPVDAVPGEPANFCTRCRTPITSDAVREARILALEAELSTLRGDSRPAFRYDHSTPLKDPYAHTGVRPWGGWRSEWKPPTRPRVRFGISWSVRENIEPAAVERSGSG